MEERDCHRLQQDRMAVIKREAGSRQSIWPRTDPRRRRITLRKDSQAAQIDDDRRRPRATRSRDPRNLPEIVSIDQLYASTRRSMNGNALVGRKVDFCNFPDTNGVFLARFLRRLSS